MTRILITGAAGCLGRALSLYLKSKDKYETCATSRSLSGSHIDSVLDVSDIEKLRILLQEKNPDIIFHLVSTYSHDFQTSYYTNVELTKNLLEIVLTECSATRVILIGSAAEYGFIEEQANPIQESFRLQPITTYGLTKAWQSLLMPYFCLKGLNVVLARIFNLYGDGASPTLLVGHILNQIKAYQAGTISRITTGDLSQSRDYISIEQAARMLELIALKGKPGEIYHIGTGVPILVRDLVFNLLNQHHVSKNVLFENKGEYNHKGASAIYADLTKTKNLAK